MRRGLGSGPSQLEKALGAGPRQGDVHAWGGGGGGALRRVCAWKRRSSSSKGASSEFGVRDFGGKALGEGVWLGFRPSAVGGGLRGGLRV